MTKADLLINIKSNLRISTTSFDTELNALIDEGLNDIKLSFDIGDNTDNDLLADTGICGAIRTYVRSRFLSGDDHERYDKSYQTQIQKLAVKYNAASFSATD